MITTKKQKHGLKCLKCNYKWGSRSTKKYVTCPNCIQKVENKWEVEIENGDGIGCTMKDIGDENAN